MTGANLTLVRPLGFTITSKHLKRAGMDYWNEANVTIIDQLEMDERPTYFFSTKASRLYTEITFEENARLIFGSESGGLPPSYHKNYADNFYTIPMKTNMRSLNLSNSVAIILYEALRQSNFNALRQT